ncbi:Tat pathway signal sequence domain protein [Streptomyces sp. AC602_WCS936]|uniref:Tat pathway signal sequence domain protein n=1 Tax=Streptomyces sp. AC602_WCS936 TaxID=2823685 RepID=UPI001C2756A5|nr:Tat pathway signal sequence domain protein [Streptomyces sp. AC602_WCS936]
MTGTGPVEPGEGTRARDAAGTPRPPARPRGRLARRYADHRRAALATAAILGVLAGSGYLYASRPRQPAPPPPPYPVHAVDLVYLDAVPGPGGADPGALSFAVRLSVRSGPPVTLTRLAQPYEGLTITSSPAAPFQTKSHSARKIIVTLRVTECEKAPRNLGFPFLDVTLRNTRAIQTHSFILGSRYAQDLSEALQVACGYESR